MNSESNRTFKQECKIIDLSAEYNGYTGYEQYAIITDLTEEELNARYEDELAAYKPFIILSREMGLVIREHQRNNNKFKKRLARGAVDYETILFSLSVEDEQTLRDRMSDEAETNRRFLEAGRKAFMSLTPLQREYVIRYYIDGLTLEEIAKETGKHTNTIWGICERARIRFIKAVNAWEVA